MQLNLYKKLTYCCGIVYNILIYRFLALNIFLDFLTLLNMMSVTDQINRFIEVKRFKRFFCNVGNRKRDTSSDTGGLNGIDIY